MVDFVVLGKQFGEVSVGHFELSHLFDVFRKFVSKVVVQQVHGVSFNSEDKNLNVDRYGVEARTTITGRWLWANTCAVTLPKMSFSSPLRPWEPITITSACATWAASMMLE